MFPMKPANAISLRPDPSALHTAAFNSLTRAALAVARSYASSFASAHPGSGRPGDDPPPIVMPDDRGAKLLLRSPTAPLTTDDASMLQHIALVFLRTLTEVCAGAKLLANGLELNFGRNVISCPTITAGGAKFIAEGCADPGDSISGALGEIGAVQDWRHHRADQRNGAGLECRSAHASRHDRQRTSGDRCGAVLRYTQHPICNRLACSLVLPRSRPALAGRERTTLSMIWPSSPTRSKNIPVAVSPSQWPCRSLSG